MENDYNHRMIIKIFKYCPSLDYELIDWGYVSLN